MIVGATGGIGSKVTGLLSKSGANIYVTGRNANSLQKLAEECGLDAEKVFLVDITDASLVNEVVAKIVANENPIDILINASGIGIIKPMDILSGEEFSRTLQTNLMGVFYLMKAILPGMKARKKGLIINIPGVLGKVPMAGAAAYSASKYGLVGMMQSIREELKRTDIRITNLFLGGVDSSFWDTIDLRVQRDKMIMAEEAAKAIWFLCQQPVSGVVSEMVIQPFNHQAL